MPNVFFHPYQLGESISNFRVVGWYFSFVQILKETSVSKHWRADQTLPFWAPDLVVHCLMMSYKKNARLIWVNYI